MCLVFSLFQQNETRLSDEEAHTLTALKVYLRLVGNFFGIK